MDHFRLKAGLLVLFHRLEPDRAVDVFPGKESVHRQAAAERAEPLGGGLQIFPLPRFQLR